MLRGRAERGSVVRTCSSLRPQRNWGWLHLLGTCLPPLPRTNRAHASSLTMDHGFLPRSMWTSDSKVPHQTTDVFTSVVVTRNIPCGTSFGPCVLQHTFYDTIAFIAQKSCDKKTKPYVFRVDPDGMRNSALVLSWLRLVQAARNSEEQNLEAYLKAGRLYVRTTRDIKQEEELLVWYDQELSYLLGIGDMAMKMSTDDFKCLKCNQGFKNEYPFLAHCRFLCAQAKSDASSREAYERKHMEIKRQHRVTDFHNIARDLEHKRPTGEDAEVSFKKRKYEEGVYPKGRKSVLLEKTNISNDSNITQLTRDYEQTAIDSPASISKLRSEKYPANFIESKNSAFTEVGETKGTFTHDGESTIGERPAVSSAFSPILANSQAEQKSAFCKPRKRTPNSDFTAHIATAPTTSSHHQDDVADVFTSKTRHIGYSNLISSNLLDTLQGAQSVPAQVTMGGAFHFAPDQWSRSIGAPLQTTSSLTILPPTFTSFGVSVQNWCAKCNLSFRMTSDLVFHMRSHHKKEFALESHVRRRREEKLTCPICHEYFRERHHLSRHMTSHN